MSAPSPLFSSLHQRLSANSRQLLSSSSVLPTTAVSTPVLEPAPATSELTAVAPGQALAQDQVQAPALVQAAVAEPVPALSPTPILPNEQSDDDEKLTLFDSILTEAEQIGTVANGSPSISTTPDTPGSDASALFASVPPQALPQATEDMWQQAQPQEKSGTSKERADAAWSVEAAVQESGGMLAAVEQEKQPEITAELESYLQRVEHNQESPAKELAQLIPLVAATTAPAATELVRVLPVTKTTAAVGRTKNPKFSIRWLIEWSDKLVKMFRGKIAYRSAVPAST